MSIFKFQEPFIGVIFFLGIFAFVKMITKNNGIALMAGLLASLCDVIIFYQSEFHPQGLAYVFFIFFIYMYYKCTRNVNIPNALVVLILMAALTLSHHFSSVFVAIVGILYIVWLLAYSRISIIKKIFGNGINKNDIIIWCSSILMTLLYLDSTNIDIIRHFIYFMSSLSAFGSLVTMGAAVPIYTTLMNSVKWITFFIAAIYCLYIFKIRDTAQYRLAFLMLSIVFLGVIGVFVVFGPTDRFIGFYMIFASIFMAMALFKFRDEWLKRIPAGVKIAAIVAIASLVMVVGTYNAQLPAYLIKESGTSSYYWYSNDLNSVAKYEPLGQWINNFTAKNSTYYIEFDTVVIPFFYGNRSTDNLLYYEKLVDGPGVEMPSGNENNDYIVITTLHPDYFQSDDFSKESYVKSINVFYTDGIHVVGDTYLH